MVLHAPTAVTVSEPPPPHHANDEAIAALINHGALGQTGTATDGTAIQATRPQ